MRVRIPLVVLLMTYSLQLIAYAEGSADYVKKGWALRGAKKYAEAYKVTEECITKYSKQADRLAATLTDFPSSGDEETYKVMNNVAECYFIRGEAFRDEQKKEESKKNFQIVVDKYPYAQAFDPRGWYWKLAEAAQSAISQWEGECWYPPNPVEEQTKVDLYDEGSEFPVDYTQYGKFTGVGTRNYKYLIDDPIGLAKAVGEGIYPNTSSIKFDPAFVAIKKKLRKLNHWKLLNSRDLHTAFYKWNTAPEPPGVKQFHIAEILERSGHLKAAIKAYYAVLVHFPRSYGWTYWHTPWYVGKGALYRIKYLLKNNPQLDLRLENAEIRIINGYDNEIRNDIFVVNPGKLVSLSFWDKKFARKNCNLKKRKLGRVVESRGDWVRLVKYASGDWQMLVNNKPFIIKSITYGPTRIGESPDDGSMQNWITQDLNKNGLIDAPEEAWVDKNRNNIQDKDEGAVGDFALMKEMGVNSIRLYHQPFALDKKILGQMYAKYGIYILLGDFLGKYTLGSGAEWEKGTDYDNPEQKQNMLASVKKMVLEFKDEPYVLVWLLGNENVYGLGCNADKKPESFFKFANEAARLIKSLDPKKRPVAVVSGDFLYLDIFAQHCPDVDIFGTNTYRGAYGFLDLWDEIKRIADKPAMITEYGTSSYAQGYTIAESEAYQAEYHKACWLDIMHNSCGFGAGNAIGGIAFEWIDEWWKAYEPLCHNRKGLFTGPFLDGYMHEEWLGLCGLGEGKHSPYLRQLKESYYTYKELWN